MRNSQENIKKFTQALTVHAERKSTLYDGVAHGRQVNEAIILATEEFGEVASACIRQRWILARYECIDLAHCAMLIAFAIDELIIAEGKK